MNTTTLENLTKSGVYIIKNKINDMVYVGSTTMSFKKRFQHHISMLRKNAHKNKYLQNAWNKYGEDNFEFNVIKVCDKEFCLTEEQIFIDINCNNSYNINPLASGTPNMSQETINKRAATMRKKYESGEFVSNFKTGHTPWNKGVVMGETHYLKVPKKKTKKLEELNKQKSLIFRESAPKVDIFNINNEYLGTWRSSLDIQENSLLDNFVLIPHINSRFKKGRLSKPYYYLAANHINSCLNNKLNSYKGLYFKINTAPS